MVCGSSSVNINHVQGGSVDFTWSVGGEFYSVGLERGGECGFYEQMCRPAGSGLNPWKYGGRGQQDIFSHVKFQTVSKRVGQEKLKKPKASEIDLFCQNQLVFVSTPSLNGVFVSQRRTYCAVKLT